MSYAFRKGAKVKTKSKTPENSEGPQIILNEIRAILRQLIRWVPSFSDVITTLQEISEMGNFLT